MTDEGEDPGRTAGNADDSDDESDPAPPDEGPSTASNDLDDAFEDVSELDDAFEEMGATGDAFEDADDPEEATAPESGTGGGETVEPPGAGSEEASIERSPFEDLDGTTENGEEITDEDLDELFEEAFTEESIEDVDALWEELESHEDEVAGAPEEDVVPARSFCEQCPHLSEPPEFRCTHEGTEIVEFVDSDHVKVRDCPVVERRRGADVE